MDFYLSCFFWGLQQVPGFAVRLEAHFFGFAMRIETEHGRGGADFHGDDVPDVEGDDVGGDEVDVFLGVGGASFAGGIGGAGFVGTGTDGFGAFDLNAVEAASVVEDEVVAQAVAPGFGDAEFEVGGLVEETGFGAFSGDLGIFARGAACWACVGWLWRWLYPYL